MNYLLSIIAVAERSLEHAEAQVNHVGYSLGSLTAGNQIPINPMSIDNCNDNRYASLDNI